jgi:hypothetical protein
MERPPTTIADRFHEALAIVGSSPLPLAGSDRAANDAHIVDVAANAQSCGSIVTRETSSNDSSGDAGNSLKLERTQIVGGSNDQPRGRVVVISPAPSCSRG